MVNQGKELRHLAQIKRFLYHNIVLIYIERRFISDVDQIACIVNYNNFTFSEMNINKS